MYTHQIVKVGEELSVWQTHLGKDGKPQSAQLVAALTDTVAPLHNNRLASSITHRPMLVCRECVGLCRIQR